MTRNFSVIIERDNAGYYVATVPALHGCHTQAKSLDKLMERVKEVIELCLLEQDETPPDCQLVGVQSITMTV